jgi:hypothetical protein
MATAKIPRHLEKSNHHSRIQTRKTKNRSKQLPSNITHVHFMQATRENGKRKTNVVYGSQITTSQCSKRIQAQQIHSRLHIATTHRGMSRPSKPTGNANSIYRHRKSI